MNGNQARKKRRAVLRRFGCMEIVQWMSAGGGRGFLGAFRAGLGVAASVVIASGVVFIAGYGLGVEGEGGSGHDMGDDDLVM